jgi:hypothetical protein
MITDKITALFFKVKLIGSYFLGELKIPLFFHPPKSPIWDEDCGFIRGIGKKLAFTGRLQLDSICPGIGSSATES